MRSCLIGNPANKHVKALLGGWNRRGSPLGFLVWLSISSAIPQLSEEITGTEQSEAVSEAESETSDKEVDALICPLANSEEEKGENISWEVHMPGKNGEIQITDALLKQAEQGLVLAYKFKGKRFDCGSVDGFVEATNYCYKNIYAAE